MPLSSQMHTPKLMSEDDVYIKFGCDPEEFDLDGHETKDTEDGVSVTMAKRKSDKQMAVFQCSFKKPDFDHAKACDWMSKQKFSLEPADMHSVQGVEIFSTGLWNGKQITNETLDLIADAFAQTKSVIKPHLKLGHDEDQKLLQSDGLPAAGWVENVRKVGSKLVADFVDIPKKVYQLIKNNAYRKVSCEIYNNIEIDGRQYPKLLGAVALLGADMPGVLNLNDILSMYCAPTTPGMMEKFAASSKVDIITSELPHTKDGQDMPPELDLEQYKAKAAETEKELADAKAEVEKYKNEAAEAQKKVLEVAKEKKAAQVDAFVASIQAKKLCSKAMEPFVKALLGDEMETYAIADEKLTKSQLVEKILTFSSEAAKVNFEETTSNEGGDIEGLDVKVEKYAKEHNVGYGAAYRAVTRGLNIPAKPL